jgi:hypothetical protein
MRTAQYVDMLCAHHDVVYTLCSLPHSRHTRKAQKLQTYHKSNLKVTVAAHLTPLPHSSRSSYASALVGHDFSASATSARFDLLLLLRPALLGQVASDPRLFDCRMAGCPAGPCVPQLLLQLPMLPVSLCLTVLAG